ncbi:MAG: RloB family protein [Thermoguttaceae bacterium]|jgi:hypothetical protein
MSNARDRQRRKGRKPPFRDPKPCILIVSEGDVTEPEYFWGFVKDCRNPRVDIRVADEHGVPKTLVGVAKKYKREAEEKASREEDENLAYDSVWCVFDIDDHAHVGEAKEMARDNGIELAISNPCFELWLLLHFRDNPGMQHRDKIEKNLKDYVPKYDKHVDYATYSEGYPQAVTRANKMDQDAENAHEPHRNPTTGVYKLTKLILG